MLEKDSPEEASHLKRGRVQIYQNWSCLLECLSAYRYMILLKQTTYTSRMLDQLEVAVVSLIACYRPVTVQWRIDPTYVG